MSLFGCSSQRYFRHQWLLPCIDLLPARLYVIGDSLAKNILPYVVILFFRIIFVLHAITVHRLHVIVVHCLLEGCNRAFLMQFKPQFLLIGGTPLF